MRHAARAAPHAIAAHENEALWHGALFCLVRATIPASDLEPADGELTHLGIWSRRLAEHVKRYYKTTLV